MGLQITDFSENEELYDGIRRYHTLLQMTFESNVYKLFETQHGLVVRFLKLNPGPAAVDPGQVKKDLAGAKSVDADVTCPLCKSPIPLQLKLARGVPDKPGRIPYPKGDELTCPKWQKRINLAGARREIESQIGKKVVAP